MELVADLLTAVRCTTVCTVQQVMKAQEEKEMKLGTHDIKRNVQDLISVQVQFFYGVQAIESPVHEEPQTVPLQLEHAHVL